MTTNSHMLAVRPTTFGAFCLAPSMLDLCFLEVCVCSYTLKGPRAAEVQSQVHVLKCGPRDGPYYPCLLHQQGPGARAGSWPFVSKQMEAGRGETEQRNGEEEEEEEEENRVSLFSLSAVLKKTSPHNASAASDGPPSHSGSRSDHLYLRFCSRSRPNLDTLNVFIASQFG